MMVQRGLTTKGGELLELTVTVSKARDGKHDYIQIMSGDVMTLNFTSVADKITINDNR